MRKRFLASVICGIMLLSILGGCSSGGMGTADSNQAGQEQEEKSMTFVFLPKNQEAWFDQVKEGAEKQAKIMSQQLKTDIQIQCLEPENVNAREQNDLLMQAAALQPVGIALDPVDYESSRETIEEIRSLGIPVVLFDTTTLGGLTSIGNDYSQQAEETVAALIQAIEGKGKVAVMQGVPSASGHAERYQMYMNVLAQYPDIQVIDGGIGNNVLEEAKSQAKAVLTANPDLQGYLCCDASGAMGISDAVKEAGKQGQVQIVAIDSTPEILTAIQAGVILSTSAAKPETQGALSVLMLWQCGLGMDLPASVDVGTDFIDASNVELYLTKEGAS